MYKDFFLFSFVQSHEKQGAIFVKSAEKNKRLVFSCKTADFSLH